MKKVWGILHCTQTPSRHLGVVSAIHGRTCFPISSVCPLPPYFDLTHWGQDKMEDTLQTILLNAFLNEHCCTVVKNYLKFVPKGLIKHYSINWDQWWSVCWRIYASLGLNELTPVTCLTDAIIRGQIMIWPVWEIIVFSKVNIFHIPYSISLIIRFQFHWTDPIHKSQNEPVSCPTMLH